MSRNFAKASNQYLSISSAIVTAYPFTMACWFNANDAATEYTLMALSDTAGAAQNSWRLAARGATAGDPVAVRVQVGGGGINNATTSTGFTAGAWYHACGVLTSATSRDAYINGGSGGNDNVSQTPTSLDNTTIGCDLDTAVRRPFDGLIAEAAIWNVALSVAEVGALGVGASPLLIRPSALLGYWPCFGVASPEQNMISSSNHMTVNAGPTQAKHAPVKPLWSWIRQDASVAAAAVGDTLMAQCLT